PVGACTSERRLRRCNEPAILLRVWSNQQACFRTTFFVTLYFFGFRSLLSRRHYDDVANEPDGPVFIDSKEARFGRIPGLAGVSADATSLVAVRGFEPRSRG